LLDDIDSNKDDDDIISHMCGSYVSTTNDVLAEENQNSNVNFKIQATIALSLIM
jgi:hypothetical protein